MDKQTESRKAFEAWFEGWFGEDAGEHVMLGDLIYYVNDYTNSSWKSWHASRESFAVEIDSQTIPNGQPAAWLHQNLMKLSLHLISNHNPTGMNSTQYQHMPFLRYRLATSWCRLSQHSRFAKFWDVNGKLVKVSLQDEPQCWQKLTEK